MVTLGAKHIHEEKYSAAAEAMPIQIRSAAESQEKHKTVTKIQAKQEVTITQILKSNATEKGCMSIYGAEIQ